MAAVASRRSVADGQLRPPLFPTRPAPVAAMAEHAADHATYLEDLRRVLRPAFCLHNFPSPLVERHNKPVLEIPCGAELVLPPVVVTRSEQVCSGRKAGWLVRRYVALPNTPLAAPPRPLAVWSPSLPAWLSRSARWWSAASTAAACRCASVR